VSDGIADRLQALYGLGQRPAVVRNTTDLRPPPAPTGVLRRRIGIGPDVPLVLHQGAPAPDRGGEQLIDAMTLVAGAHLVFLGTSPFAGYEDTLRRRAAAAGLGDRVRFLPSVPLERLLEHTSDADVGVSLLQDTCENHRLALPNKVFEYLVAGVPVVVSELPELAALVEREGVGWTVDPACSRALAAALAKAVVAARQPAFRARVRSTGARLSWSVERRRLEAVYGALGAAPPLRRRPSLARWRGSRGAEPPSHE